MALSETHRTYLLDHAITDETLAAWPLLRTEPNDKTGQEEIVFPWTDGDQYTEQRRPWPGESGVYFWESGKDLHFWCLRDAGPTSPILLVEGTKQSLAAASWAPEGYTVLGMAGCWGWIHTRLARFKGRTVLVCLDADASSNLDVYEAGEKFGEKARRFKVEVKYLRIPGTGSQGLDDYLAEMDEEDRTELLATEIEMAGPKPADKKPTTRKRKMESDMPDLGDRVGVAINLDRKMVIDKITDALKERHDGRDLFNYGEVLTRVKGHETQPLDRDRFYAILADAVACFRYSEATDKRPAVFEPSWPDGPSIGAIMSKAEYFAPLKRVVRVPFLRPDGTICSTPGYDRPTATVLVSSGLGDLNVPEEPTHEQTRMAAKFLLEDWLGDMPFESDADRANALAMILTPFMRGIVPLAPLAVVNGLEAGVGKNLLADCTAILATGEAALPLPYVNNEEEMRKQITSAFASGAELFVFDEAHVIEGAQFSRAVTSVTYGDRVLGVSRIANFPNQVTWMSLGNQVQVNGDMSRRVYFVCLSPAGTTLADRESYSYRHADLKAWTEENRTELVSAALTVLRGWVAAGRPRFSRGASMGSFEPWDRFMSGVLAFAGVEGFLTDARKRRSESDFTHAYWEAHVSWLHSQFGETQFTTGQVREAALRDPQGYEAPPQLEDATGKNYTRELGKAYSKNKDRTYSGLRLTKAGIGHKSTLKWQIVPGSGGNGGNGGNPTLYVHGGDISDVHTTCSPKEGGSGVPSQPSVPSADDFEDPTPAQVRPMLAPSDPFKRLPDATAELPDRSSVGFDLETGSVEQLFLGGNEGPYVRLGGTTGEADVTTRMSHVITELNTSDEIYGHNILGFDLLALAHHNGADYDALAAKAVDTQAREYLVDPPMSKRSPKGYYGLDQTAARYGVTGKTDDIKALAKKHGGFDRIPLDDPEYNDYLRGDLAATKAVKDAQDARIKEMGLQVYAAREMRVVALQNRVTLNGWKVDEERLAEAVGREAGQRAEAVRILNEEFGMPLRRPDRYKLLARRDWPVEAQTYHGFYSNLIWTQPEGEDGEPVGPRVLERIDIRRGRVGVWRRYMQLFPEAAVRRGVAVCIPGEPYDSPWATDSGREAVENAFRAAGANTWPTTKTGALALSADALGEGEWYDADARKAKPGMLKIHGDKPGVRRVVETLARATGARDKYAEISKYVTREGRVHPWVGSAQGTGRWAYVKPSTSTTGKRGAGADERSVLVADEGHLLVSCDASQVDVRAVAGHCQDPTLIEMLQPGKDYHTEMAVVFFNDPSRRPEGKPISHAMNYNMGARTCAERNGLDLDFVYGAYHAHGEKFPVLLNWKGEAAAQAATGMLLDNGFGRLMRPDPERAHTQGPALYGQGAARDIVCESLLRLVDRDPRTTQYIRGVIHDEVVLSVPEEDVAYWQEVMLDAFTWEWRGVPILADLGTPAYRWSDCK